MRPVDPDHLVHAVGRRIAELRVAKKLTQDEAAERADISLKYLQRVEAGGENLTLASLARFANLFEVPIQSLFRQPRNALPKPGRPAKKSTRK